MERLLDLRILPIVNENDTVATHEIRFGDNDRLAALVALLVDADLLVLLSDVDALYTKPPQEPGAERIDEVAYDDALEGVEIGSTGLSGVGTGGALTKVSAARQAAEQGTAVILTATALVAEALRGEQVGTWFAPAQDAAPHRLNLSHVSDHARRRHARRQARGGEDRVGRARHGDHRPEERGAAGDRAPAR